MARRYLCGSVVAEAVTKETEDAASIIARHELNKVTQKIEDMHRDNAQRNWDRFYKGNTDKFFQDRHYLLVEFPVISALNQMTDRSPVLLECGAGVGNALYPLMSSIPNLNTFALDFSPLAIKMITEHADYNPDRCTALVHDMTQPMPSQVQDIDVCLLLFALSALPPDKMRLAVGNIASVLAPGGHIAFRDYAYSDMTQLRFRSKSCIRPQLYIRTDGTFSYFFHLDEVRELFTLCGLEVVDCQVLHRTVTNRKENVVMERRWIQAVFRYLTLCQLCDVRMKVRSVIIMRNDDGTLCNFSGNMSWRPGRIHVGRPEQAREIMMKTVRRSRRLRILGSCLSPNGLGFAPGSVDHDALVLINGSDPPVIDGMTVTVDGCTLISDILVLLRPYQLTLRMLGSIARQTIAGLISAGVHGNAFAIPPLDTDVIALDLVTPARGILHLSNHNDPELFHMAKLSMGCFGLITRVTLQCFPCHRLSERVCVLTRTQLSDQFTSIIKANQRVQLLWIPYADAIVVLTRNIVDGRYTPVTQKQRSSDPFAALRPFVSDESIRSDPKASLAALRYSAVLSDPTNVDHLRAIGEAEAQCWRNSNGERVGESHEVMLFDCLYPQCVAEWAFPVAPQHDSESSRRDLELMTRLMDMIEHEQLPAHSPIEQRWTSASSAPMSPAYSPHLSKIFSWVGIIMYLPRDRSSAIFDLVNATFSRFHATCLELLEEFGAAQHWAKVVVPEEPGQLARLKHSIRRRFPVDRFNRIRRELDPDRLFTNQLLDTLLNSTQSRL